MNPHRFRTRSLQDERILRIITAALEAVEPYRLVQDYLAHMTLPAYQRLFLLGIGKAAEPMTLAAADVLTSFTNALIVTKRASRSTRDRIAVFEGGHPIPDSRSLAAGRAALEFVSRLNEKDLLICLISGGGSALVTVPNEGIALQELQVRTASLLASGATIHEINRLRRQLDRIKGGGLARATKAKIIGLILSDVIGGNPLETIASGLTVDPALGDRVQNFILGDLQRAAEATKQQAIAEGFKSGILDLEIQGEAREVGLQLAKRLKEERRNTENSFCLIAGGEATVTIKGNGRGGRNQELALAAVDELDGMQQAMLISLATDGDDGPTDAAGAVVTGETHQRAQRLGMSASDYLSRNDAYPFFESLGDLLKPGYTGTNVNDLIFLVGF